MRFFRREVETVLKLLGAAILVGLIVLPMGWAYEERQQARAWQSVACTYRLREVAQRTPLMATVGDARDPCQALRQLGLDLDVLRIAFRRVNAR